MSEQTPRDLRLVGTTTGAGGFFRNVRVTGEAELNGDTQCRNFNCIGNFRLAGSLRTERFKLTGDCRVEGGLLSDHVRTVGELQLSESFRAERAHVTGELKAGGHCEAETLEVGGVVNIGGTLNAERFVLKLHGPSRASEIGGGSISVKRSRAVLLKWMFGHGDSALLEAELIEGDTIVLEHTHAAIVRGNRVTIGTGCSIGRVEYREELKVGSKAEVRKRIKL